MTDLLKKFQKSLARRGLLQTLLLAMTKLIEPVFETRKVIITVNDLRNPVRNIAPKTSVEVKVLEDYESTKKTDLSSLLDDEDIRLRYEQGQVIGVALAGAKVVSYMWLRSGHHYLKELELTMLLNGAQCVTYNGYTLEEWRGHNLYPAIFSVNLEWAKARGFETRFGYIVASNRSALSSIVRKGGAQELRKIRLIKIAGRRFWWFGPTRLDFELDFTPEQQRDSRRIELCSPKAHLLWRNA